MTRYIFILNALLSFMLGSTTLAIEPERPCRTPLENLTGIQKAMVTSSLGTVNGCIGTPFQHWKNALQNREPIPPFKHLWRGTGVNIVRSTPSTLPEVFIMGNADAIIKAAQLPLPCDTQKACLAFAVASPGTLLNTIAEQIVMRSRCGGSSYAIARNIVQSVGPRGLFRGFSPKFMRDGTGSLAYWYAAPKLKSEYTKRGLQEPVATIAAGASVALPAALLTQPLDTISTAMQNDLGRTRYRSTLQSIATYSRTHGIKSLLRGITPRATSAIIRIPALITTQEYLTTYLGNTQK